MRSNEIPSGARLLDGKSLLQVRGTITAGTKKINFVNPVGGFLYHSGLYESIAKLITQGHIAVFFSSSGGDNFYKG